MGKIIILKQTKDGIVADTIYNEDSSDSLSLSVDVSGTNTLQLPPDAIEVNTPGKDVFDYTLGTITIIGAIIAAVFTWKSIRKLYQKDEDKQAQIDELIKQSKELATHNTLYEKRIRMIHKPRIWSNGGSTSGFENEWSIRVDNKGEEATITNVEIVGGDKGNAEFFVHALPYELSKGDSSLFKGKSINKNPNDLELEIKVSYTDIEGYEYETTFKWKGGGTTILETKEL